MKPGYDVSFKAKAATTISSRASRDIAFSGDLNAYPNSQSVKQNLPDGDLNTMQRQYKVENAYPSPLKQNLQLKPL